MMNFSITENNLKMKKFTRSKNLSNLQDYMTPKKNPILSCLIDQLTLDFELRKRNSCQFTLLKGIIDSLKEGNISWPSHFTLMFSEKWIQMMRTDSNFYWHHAGSSSEMNESVWSKEGDFYQAVNSLLNLKMTPTRKRRLRSISLLQMRFHNLMISRGTQTGKKKLMMEP